MTGHPLRITNNQPSKEYFRMDFDCLLEADKVAIIAFMCGTNLGAAKVSRDIDHDIRSMLDAGIKHIYQVEKFAENILNSLDFETNDFNEWIDTDPFDLDFGIDTFWHIYHEMNEDMRTVVRFCYPFDDKSNLDQNGISPFIEAFCR